MGLEGTSGGCHIHPPTAKLPNSNFCIPPSYFNRWITLNTCKSLNPSFFSPGIETVKEIIRQNIFCFYINRFENLSRFGKVLISSPLSSCKKRQVMAYQLYIGQEEGKSSNSLSKQTNPKKQQNPTKLKNNQPQKTQHCNPGSNTLRGKCNHGHSPKIYMGKKQQLL